MKRSQIVVVVIVAALWLLLVVGMVVVQDAGDGRCSGLHVGGGDCIEMIGGR